MSAPPAIAIIRGMTRPIRPLIAVIVLAVARLTVHAADTHRYVPDRFYNTYSAAHPPAVHVKPGDHVVTKTIDAAGVDWNEKAVGIGPNPQTGPFFVDGAEPGDVLIVRFDRIETNRRMAYSA